MHLDKKVSGTYASKQIFSHNPRGWAVKIFLQRKPLNLNHSGKG
jgi:hypothetical protein